MLSNIVASSATSATNVISDWFENSKDDLISVPLRILLIVARSTGSWAETLSAGAKTRCAAKTSAASVRALNTCETFLFFGLNYDYS